MKQYFTFLSILIIIAAISVGCGSKKEKQVQGKKEAVVEKTKELTEDFKAATEALEAMKEEAEHSPENVEPINFRELIKLLPEPLPGWKIKDKADGRTQTFGSKWSYSEASQKYVKANSSIEITIKDGAYIPMLYTMFAFGSAYKEDTSEKYQKGFSKGDNKGFEEFYYNEKKGTVNLLVAKRFIIEAEGKQIENTQILHDFINKIDQKKLEELAKKKSS